MLLSYHQKLDNAEKANTLVYYTRRIKDDQVVKHNIVFLVPKSDVIRLFSA
jgi:hypothetical protein